MKKTLFVMLVLLIAGLAAAQSAIRASAPSTVTAYRDAVIYSGPGDTYRQLGVLRPGIPAQIVERNRIGNWLHITRTANDGSLLLDGWVLSGYLNLDASLRYSQLAVNTTLADADPSTVNSRSMARLYAVPIIPSFSLAMVEVYRRGQDMGNLSHVATKIGDSVCANPMFLKPMSQPDYQLGPYDYLKETIDYFGLSLATDSVAARGGMTTYVVFDPLWADKTQCQPNETPLDCEYRLKQPSIAFIMFGPNDVRHMTDADFDGQMRQLVEQTLAQGIIPVLTTFSADPDKEFWWQSINFNLVLAEIAAEYETPIINLWAAARVLPDYGLDIDGVHMKNSGFTYLNYTTGHESWYGVSLQNLLSLRTLDEFRQTVINLPAVHISPSLSSPTNPAPPPASAYHLATRS